MARKVGSKSDVVFQKTFEGGWEKEIVRRSDGISLDAYVTHPKSGKKLRSGNDLLKFVQENPKYLKYLDPHEVNFSKNPGKKLTPQVQKFIQSILELKSQSGYETNNSGDSRQTSEFGKKSSKKSKSNMKRKQSPEKKSEDIREWNQSDESQDTPGITLSYQDNTAFASMY